MLSRRRRVRTLLVAAVLAAALTACTPEPEPTPTPTGFASEEEAFRAAEETYRAYVDALNEVDLADPATFEPMLSWTAGSFTESERKIFSEYHAEGVTVSGLSHVSLAELVSWDATARSVSLAGCVNVSEVQVVDAQGNSLVAADRPDIQSTLVKLELSPTPTLLAISSIEGREGEPECG